MPAEQRGCSLTEGGGKYSHTKKTESKNTFLRGEGGKFQFGYFLVTKVRNNFV